MKAETIRDLDNNEIQTQIREITEQLGRLRFQLGMGQAEGLKKYRALRKDRARLLTVARARERAAPAEVPAAKG
jgi:large subunit ribosomal protein L29